jgi:long-chain acyl-CoA synthetase
LRLVFRLQVKGLDRVPIGDAFVLTPNHVSLLDPFAVAAALDDSRLRQTFWGGASTWAFGNPVTRSVSRLTRTVPIDPQRAAVSSLAFGAALLQRGDNLVWFPEGERAPDGKLKPFRPGIGMLLERYPTAVVPVWISGTFAALPPGRWLPRLRRVTVRFGDPLDPQQLVSQGNGDDVTETIAQALHDAVADIGRAAGETC